MATTLETQVQRLSGALTYEHQTLQAAVKSLSVEGEITTCIGGVNYQFSRLLVRDPRPMDMDLRGEMAVVEEKRRVRHGQVQLTGYREDAAQTQLMAQRQPYVDPAEVRGYTRQGQEIVLRQVPGTLTFTVRNGVLTYC